MEDPETLPTPPPDADGEHAGTSQEDRQRLAEEAMEQMLLAQEAQDGAGGAGVDGNDDDGEDPGNNGNDDVDHEVFDEEGFLAGQGRFDDDDDDDNGAMARRPHNTIHHHGEKRNPFSYVQLSFFAAAALVYYAFRSRQQWYLALVYLSSSKWAYVILGNALVASLIWTFQLFTGFFLDGLRLAEAEGLGDFFRWNITETCLALTIFRNELTVKTGVLFLIFVLAKCLHWVADTREGHLRMTEEVVVVRPSSQWPSLRWPHVKLLLCLYVLQLMDVLAVIQCGHDIWQNGPSVSILFAFEAAIMLTSAVSNILLWHLHLTDGLFHYAHETTNPSHPLHRWIHPWKDHKATMIFAVEVQAQAAKFFFYVTFFAIVMSYYALPINLIREVYVSFQALKQRLTAFGKYRQLMSNMNRFSNPTAEELEEESTCIICRDEMNLETAKQLPGCGHIFHKSCLREWLVQQQTCPTCRSDISAMEARQRQQGLLNARIQDARIQAQERQETGPAITPVDGAHEVLGDNAPRTDVASSQTSSVMERAAAAEGSSAAFQDLGQDTEPNASSSAASNRGKRVRIGGSEVAGVAAEVPSLEGIFVDHDRPAFPAFYRVVKDAGAPVYHDGEAVSFVIRFVPFGVVILGRELAWRNCDGENQLMVRMPDGWVNDDDIERIVAVPFEALQ